MNISLDILHHSVVFYMLTGWIYNYNLHFIFMICAIFSWILNNNKCIISKWQGKNNNEHSSEYFKKIGLELNNEEVSFTNILLFSYVTLLSLVKL